MKRIWLLLGLCFLSVQLGWPQKAGPPPSSNMQLLKERAEKGDSEAENELGRAYELGIAVQQNYAEALRWYRKAAADGNKEARSALAGMYFEGLGVAKSYSEAARWYGCPSPSEPSMSGCKEITYADLPPGAKALLKRLKCDIGSGDNYDYGSAVDLNDDQVQEYQFCCHSSSHGPCSSVLIGKVGSHWQNLTPKYGISGYAGACTLTVVLAQKSNGFHDICLPNVCATTGSKTCVPTVLTFQSGYEPSLTNSEKPPVQGKPSAK